MKFIARWFPILAALVVAKTAMADTPKDLKDLTGLRLRVTKSFTVESYLAIGFQDGKPLEADNVWLMTSMMCRLSSELSLEKKRTYTVPVGSIIDLAIDIPDEETSVQRKKGVDMVVSGNTAFDACWCHFQKNPRPQLTTQDVADAFGDYLQIVSSTAKKPRKK